MVKKQGDSLQQEEFPLPKYVQETLSKHNISLSPTLGMGKVEGALLDTLAFQSHRYPDVDMPYLLNQIAGWQTAKAKLPTWAANEDIIYPPHLSMEQCSSEQTADYKLQLAARLLTTATGVNDASHALSQIVPESLLVDLTGGFGVDFSFISRCFERAVYVEQQEKLCEVAQHNFQVLGLSQVEVVHANSTEYLHSLSHATLIYLDPARRNEQGGKTVLINDCTPDVITLESELLEKADTVMIKLSPMLDWHRAVDELNRIGDVVREVHIVSVRNECKELLIIIKQKSNDGEAEPLRIVCVNDGNAISYAALEAKDMQQKVIASPPVAGQFLYEPNTSLMKSGCFALLTERYDVAAVDVNSHLFVSETLTTDFPGRSFEITAVSSFNKKEVRRTLSGITKANIAVRNFPMSVADLRKRLKLKEGGDVYLFATTDASGNHLLLVCRKV